MALRKAVVETVQNLYKIFARSDVLKYILRTVACYTCLVLVVHGFVSVEIENDSCANRHLSRRSESLHECVHTMLFVKIRLPLSFQARRVSERSGPWVVTSSLWLRHIYHHNCCRSRHSALSYLCQPNIPPQYVK